MSRTVFTFLSAAGMSAALAAGQPQSRPAEPQQPHQSQEQTDPKSQSVTLTGCVYQATDQPPLFALRTMGERNSEIAGAAGPPAPRDGHAGTAGVAGVPGAADSPSPRDGHVGAAGTTGDARAGAPHAPNVAWYRLASQPGEDLKQYAGRAVRVTGTLAPGAGGQGADLGPDRVQMVGAQVTASDLEPAPQVQIQSIGPADGECK